MQFLKRGWIATSLLALALGAAPARSARADDATFDRFCADWMAKLARREHQNLAKVRWEKQAGALVGRYTGYERVPIQCSPTSRVTPGKPAVGKLVYREIVYQKRGQNPAAAREAEPLVLQTTEVMEVFRYDGRKWMY